MLSDFLININRLGCGGKGPRILLAVSGGVDSVVMASLFEEAGSDCGIAHCNFRLRGEASEMDALSVRQLAKRLSFTLHETSFDTRKAAADWKVSTQMAARKLRYDWFSEIAAGHGYSHIATAHHAGDQVETVLLNLVRGSGIRGLRGIPAVNGNIIRPLLFATRNQIMEYAADNGLSWREDQSNSDDYYRRNRIRMHVVPVLKSINPSLEATISEMVDRLGEVGAFLDQALLSWKKEVVSEEGNVLRIDIDGIRRAPGPAFQLYTLLGESGFSYNQVKEIIAGFDGISGKEFHSPTHILVKDRDSLLVTEKALLQRDEAAVSIQVEVFTRPDDFEIRPAPATAFFDADILKFPLKVRKWCSGDSFRPFGMNGRKKKVSDLLIDRKLNRIAKERIQVLVDDDDRIVWVIGIRGEHSTRVTNDTRKIAKVTVSER